MRVCYLGNFGPSHSTENHVALSLESLGHEVVRVQEGCAATTLPGIVENAKPDLFLHTQTYGLAVSSGTKEERWEATQAINGICPTAYFHLDRWWGLQREDQLLSDPEPWTIYHHVFTADGGHDAQWKENGINHHWLPPAVYHGEAFDGTPRSNMRCTVGFVGSWRSYGHPEWEPQRLAMLNLLKQRYGRHFQCFPKGPAIRGKDLNDLYASITVVIGDSCLAGSPIRYWSDRVPETLGRGGFLIHPYVEGIFEVHPNLATWELGDNSRLIDQIEFFLANPENRENMRRVNSQHTRAYNTYRNRMQALLAEVFDA